MAAFFRAPSNNRENFMKLARFGAPGREKPGMLHTQGRIRDLSKVIPDIAGDELSPTGLAKLRKVNVDKLPIVRGTPRIGPCVGKVGNFIAIGLNYSDHAAESGMPVPEEPIIFNKAPTCICGPNDDTMIPKQSAKRQAPLHRRNVDRRGGDFSGRGFGLPKYRAPSACPPRQRSPAGVVQTPRRHPRFR